ncbi:uncharacterized protein LOC111250136 [Varroa destructor]|uniref:Uncharacterized protein n=1 Tax=Varroa destructor TaxID=109461 RepID=A0A7M7KB78_VARDE|nr:uncharacterized protein LOC111250136 [Varroa destructor]
MAPCTSYHRRFLSLSFCDALRAAFALSVLTATLHSSGGQQCQDYAAATIDCEYLGFPGSYLNKCGYCVRGSTGLDEDFGKDCKGLCGGQATRDCMGVCGGSAYLDPCSSECIVEDAEPRTVDTQSAFRDCMGRCIDTGPKAAPSPYVNDSCGICLRGGNAKDSIYKDCTGTCYLPSEQDKMAKQKCGQCIGGTSSNKKADFLDGCGNCRTAKAPCECDNGQTKDICGVCGGKAGSCLKLTEIKPTCAPANKSFEMTLYGAFSGEAPSEIVCVFRNATDPEAQIVGPPSPGIGNGFLTPSNGKVSFVCRVPKGLPEGNYFVNPRLSRLGKEERRNLTLHVFDASIGYAKMEPSRAPYRSVENKNATTIRIKFSGGNVPKFPLYCRVMSIDTPKQKILPVYPSGIATLQNECEIPLPAQSQEYIIFPTLDGLNPTSVNFSFLFYATRPQIKESYIHSDGGAVIIVFDRDVNISSLQTCEDMLTDDTVMALGGADYLLCRWATKHQLIVFLPKREKSKYTDFSIHPKKFIYLYILTFHHCTSSSVV